MERSSEQRSFSPAPCFVTMIGFTSAQSKNFEEALKRANGSLDFEIRRATSATSFSTPFAAIHAIVFTPQGLNQAVPADVHALRSMTKPGTCRVYLFVPTKEPVPSGASILDDFIQRTPLHSSEGIAEQIIEFFEEADDLNRRDAILGLRDAACLGAHKVLGLLWPLSYAFGALHFANLVRIYATHWPFPSALANPYAITSTTFFGSFFIVHCIFAIVRNALFRIRIARRLNLELAIGVATFSLAAVATALSIASIDESLSRRLVCAALAVAVYKLDDYAGRIRAECISISQLQATMADLGRRDSELTKIGKTRLGPNAFPFFSNKSSSLFISYMHGSIWSSEAAALIQEIASESGFETFLDRSSIPSGALWRQLLLRAISECGWFVAVVDGDEPATEWVLAESAYAALLRKSVGKPRILLIVRRLEKIAKDPRSPFHRVYLDLFQVPSKLRHGATILSVDDGELTAEMLLQSMGQIRQMCIFR